MLMIISGFIIFRVFVRVILCKFRVWLFGFRDFICIFDFIGVKGFFYVSFIAKLWFFSIVYYIIVFYHLIIVIISIALYHILIFTKQFISISIKKYST